VLLISNVPFADRDEDVAGVGDAARAGQSQRGTGLLMVVTAPV
jgi:hypothetical protein